jgi:hypothetical protein
MPSFFQASLRIFGQGIQTEGETSLQVELLIEVACFVPYVKKYFLYKEQLKS